MHEARFSRSHLQSMAMSKTETQASSQPLGMSTNAQAPTGDKAAGAIGKLALIIPTLNEAENIGGLLDHVRRVLDPLNISYEILVVDDDSKDGTGDVVSAISERDPRVRLVVRKGQRGLSGAILYGWKHTDADVLGVMDADLQHPPEVLPKLVAAIQRGRDVAIGSRYIPGGGTGSWNPMRKLLSAAAVGVTYPLQPRKAHAKDPMSGFFMVRRRSVDKIDFQTTGFKLLLEVLVRGQIESIEEVPFAFGLRFKGASKANFKVGWDYARLLARLYGVKIKG